MANGKNNDSQLSICGGQVHTSAHAPETIEHLRMLLSHPTLDLQAITGAIQSDLGLTVRLFQFAAERPGTVPRGAFDICEIIVHLGRKNLRAMMSAKTVQRPASSLPLPS